MKLSIGMMVKNEEENLERCLQSLQPLLDGLDSELIIVDTGSEDNTVEIAKKYTDKVYFHAWNNDFSAMRNVTISYGKGEWFLVIDADEVLENPQAIVNFIKSKDSKKFNAVLLFVNNYMKKNDSKFSTLLSHRLFRKTKNFHYTGAVHNQPIFDGAITDLPAKIHHYGYIADDKELMERKFIRTSTILKSELDKDPENIYYLYQMSVTYGMHDDYNAAIEYIEKAYQVFLKLNKPMNCVFVLTHRAMMYEMVRNFKKVEEVCLEALKDGVNCIDIYYYLAEAQAVLGKYQEAIQTFREYLDMLAGYYVANEKNIGVIDYTLGNAELAYFNLSNLCMKAGDFEAALQYAEKVTDKNSVQENVTTIINLYMKLGKYEALKHYYDQVIEKEGRYAFYQSLEEIKHQFDERSQLSVAAAFGEADDDYGLLSTIIVEEQKGVFSEKTLEKIKQIDFSKLPIGCSAILYYLLQHKYPLHTILTNFKEVWFDCLFEYITKYHDDLSRKLYEYLQYYHDSNSANEYKLSKTLCRYALLLDKLSDAEYENVFERYINEGISYLQTIYSDYVIDNVLVYEVKNDEEVFLLYMCGAQICKTGNQAEYVKYLRQALQAFPAMKRGVEMLLEKIHNTQDNEQEEFAMYQQQVKRTIKQLIDSGNMENAKALLGEYKDIVPNDMEAILLESKILLN